ncbi:MAG: hypothetical protein HY293_20840 [Planctomycetes bacterium]|nr:hypothetical protein [Planctomycetota bacterium]
MKGRRLAVVLPLRWPRWSSFLFSTIVTFGFFVGIVILVYGSDDEAHRKWTLAVVLGAFGLVCLPFWAYDFMRWLVAGDTVVEVSEQPALPGRPLDCFVQQARDHSWIRKLEARVVCRKQIHRGLIEETVSLPLGSAGAVDREGRKALLQGSLRIPDDAAASLESEPLKIRWSVEVRVTFGKNLVLTEDHPLRVGSVTSSSPPAPTSPSRT